MNDSGRQQGRRVVTADYAWYVLQSFIINNKRKTKHLPALPLLYPSLFVSISLLLPLLHTLLYANRGNQCPNYALYLRFNLYDNVTRCKNFMINKRRSQGQQRKANTQ